MNEALHRHKKLMQGYPRHGEGLEAYVDASDTGYTDNSQRVEEDLLESVTKNAGKLNGTNGHAEGSSVNVASYGSINGSKDGSNGHGSIDKVEKAIKDFGIVKS
jgi:3-dehydroquinate synthase